MVNQGDMVIVGLSGGADSVALLMVLDELKEELGIKLSAIHVNHGIRGEEADRDSDYSEKLCKSLGVDFAKIEVSVPKLARELKISEEEAGRKARYEVFEAIASELERNTGRTVHVAVAHHGDDSAETTLHNLFRGSGFAGLSGIRPVRGRIIRPLLWANHERICEYLKSRGITWMEDSTNRENDYTRNYIRNQLLPEIKEKINPRAAENILRTSAFIAEADEYFRSHAKAWVDNELEMVRKEEAACDENGIKSRKNTGREYISTERFLAAEEVLRGYIVRELLRCIGCPLKDITAAHISAVSKLAGMGTGHRVNLPYGVTAYTDYGRLILDRKSRISADADENDSETLENHHFEMHVKKILADNPMNFPNEPFRKWFDSDRINVDGLVLRTRRQGDYLMLPDGGRKTIKAFMIDNKISKDKRDVIPVVAEGSHVIWIVGYRISDGAKITDKTKNIVEIRIKEVL